jgi:hypothetical protein
VRSNPVIRIFGFHCRSRPHCTPGLSAAVPAGTLARTLTETDRRFPTWVGGLSFTVRQTWGDDPAARRPGRSLPELDLRTR